MYLVVQIENRKYPILEKDIKISYIRIQPQEEPLKFSHVFTSKKHKSIFRSKKFGILPISVILYTALRRLLYR